MSTLIGNVRLKALVKKTEFPNGLNLSNDNGTVWIRSQRVTIEHTVEVIGPASEVRGIEIGYVQNLVKQDLAFFFGTQQDPLRLDVQLKNGLTMPRCDSSKARRGWYDQSIKCSPTDAIDGLSEDNCIIVEPPPLSDQPSHSFEWSIDEHIFSHANGSTRFAWWLIAVDAAKNKVSLDGGWWEVNWNCCRSGTTVPAILGSVSAGARKTTKSADDPTKPVLAEPFANDSTEMKPSRAW